jgi:Phage protein Gp19/Gp15/Gp42
MAYATTTDVTKRWARTATELETQLIEVRLEDVERLIRRTIPDLDDLILDGEIDEADVVQVEADAVLRLVRNPEGYLSETDGSYQYMLRQDIATGKVEVLPEEWLILGVSGSKFFILDPDPVLAT